MPTPTVSPEVAYVGLLFGLFVVPRFLQRFRVPAAISSVALGALAGPGFDLLHQDSTVQLLSTLGIVSLFLFAGIEVEGDDLKREARIIGEHLLVRVVVLALAAFLVTHGLELETRAALLVALALLTPSAGFILDSLQALGLREEIQFWVRTKAIATEILALAALFFTLQSASAGRLALSSAVLIAMIVGLPVIFRAFARYIVPFAPKTEFAFLLMISVVCALVTKKLGVYYLVGAFVVGMVAQRFREQLPAMASEKMLHAIEAFASIFVPFYFFHAGATLRREDFTLGALLFGAAFLVVVVPVQLALIALHRKIRLHESFRKSLRVGVPLTPTLVFTLVLAQILRERFEAPPHIFGGLVVYALVNTVIPSVVFRLPLPAFEAPEAPSLESPPPASSDTSAT